MRYTQKQVELSTANRMLEVSEIKDYRDLYINQASFIARDEYKIALKDLCNAFGMKPLKSNLELISERLKIDKDNLDRKLFLLNELNDNSFLIGSKIDIGIISIATLEKLYEIMTRKISQKDIDDEYYATS